MKKRSRTYQALAREYAWNLLFLAGGIGSGLGVHHLLQTFESPDQVISLFDSVGPAVLIGASFAVLLHALKKVAVEGLLPAFHEGRDNRGRGLA
jgi:uncharacterized membrane protein YqgA involved in biofilm formation